MALIECPECQNKVSDMAKSCPQCGYILQDNNPKETPVVETKEEITPLFSTKSLYNRSYTIFLIFYIVPLVIGTIVFTFLGFGVGGGFWYILYYLLFRKIASKQKGMRCSYLDLYEDKICGVTTPTDNLYDKGATFTVLYQDIIHMDKIDNNIVVLHTTHGEYNVQAFNCADKVISLIQQQQEKLCSTEDKSQGETCN